MGNVAKVACIYRLGAGSPEEFIEGVWTFHVQKEPSSTPWSLGDREALALRVMDWWLNPGTIGVGDVGPGRDWFSTSLVLKTVQVFAVQPAPSAPFDYPVPDDQSVGGGIVQAVPPQCAMMIGLRTTVATRQGRGRIYFPASPHSFVGTGTGQMPDFEREHLAQTAAHLKAKIVRTGVDPDPWVLCVYSRLTGTSAAVTYFTVPDVYATQRRRHFSPVTHYDFGGDGVPV